jgi:error-prone DNA polymerase
MGFYAPAQIVREARCHGVEVRPVSVGDSAWDCTLENCTREGGGRLLALRLGLRMVRGLSAAEAGAVIAGRAAAPYASIADAHRRTRLAPATLERLAEADAFACLGVARRDALWAVRALPATDLPLFAGREDFAEPAAQIVPMKPGREVVEDYRTAGLTLRRHPVAFLRQDLAARGIVRAAELSHLRDGRRVRVAGIVLVRQKPGSAKGIMFMTIEDETGHANLVIWPTVFAAQRRLILSSGMIACHGRLQREGSVIHVIAERLDDLSDMLRSVGARGEAFPFRTGRGDEARHGGAPDTRGIKVSTRDFR